MTDQGNLEKLSVYSGVADNIKTISYGKKTSCGKAALKTRKNKYLGMIMTYIKNFWKYKKKINIVVYFHIFQLLNWVKQKDVGLFISRF